ncbi:MAG TPA: hypothetical protein VMG12_33350 [Polyangiaceae bacterium]|nr:hypothetical protein [Polyangiaceae bacterium]
MAAPAPSSPDGDAPSAELSPAVLVVGFVPGVDSANLYAAALPELPTGDVDYSGYREFSASEAYMYTSGGYVFFWNGEDRTMTRFSVGADYQLLDGPTISFANQIPGSSHHTFISPTRAYTLSRDLDQVLVWNPETMEITGSIAMTFPERPATMVSFPYYSPAVVARDRVIWDIVTVDETNNVPYPSTTLAIASTTGDEPVRFIEDERCVGGGGGRADADGNYYVRAGALWGQYAAYGAGSESVRTCLLRVRAGEDGFDSDYLLDFQELTGTYVNYPWYHVEGSRYLALVWDPARPLPSLDEFYSPDTSALFRPLLVDVDARTAVAYPDLTGGKVISSDEFTIDGVSYYQFSQTGYGVDNGSTDIVELRPEGIVPRFHVPGSIWQLARIR